MDLRFDRHDGRLRMRTMAPERQHARIIVADELYQIGSRKNIFCPTRKRCRPPRRRRTRCFKAPISVSRGTLAGNFSRHRSRSLPSRITRSVTANWS